jgi:hypothetical protein
LCSACSIFDTGIAELPSRSGWKRLPIDSWLMNDGLGRARIVYCPPASCANPAVVATFEAQGEMGARLLQALASPKTLLAAKRIEVATARDPRFKRKPAKGPPKSSEQAEPVEADGLAGFRVTLSPKVADGHSAYAVVLAKHDGDTVKAALAVTVDPQAALQEARAAARAF